MGRKWLPGLLSLKILFELIAWLWFGLIRYKIRSREEKKKNLDYTNIAFNQKRVWTFFDFVVWFVACRIVGKNTSDTDFSPIENLFSRQEVTNFRQEIKQIGGKCFVLGFFFFLLLLLLLLTSSTLFKIMFSLWNDQVILFAF